MARSVAGKVAQAAGELRPLLSRLNPRNYRIVPPANGMVQLGCGPLPPNIEYLGPRTVKHHTVPREILKKYLPAEVANDPRVRGRAGAPNRWPIPEDLHKSIHKGAGGGLYNDAFIERLEALGRKPTIEDVLRIRDDLAKQFGLEGYRP